MGKKLTEAKKIAYLKNPDLCPHCKSYNISAGDMEYGTTSAFRDVQCNECDEKWEEVFTLSSVQAIK